MLALALAAAPALAGEFMDVWVTTAFEDTNLLAGPSGRSPAPNFVTRGNQTFFEQYETRFTDDVNQSFLVLYRKDEGFHPNWFTEAAMVARFNPAVDPNDSNPTLRVADDGSYVRVGYKFGGDEDHTLSMTGFAVDANRFRLGYSFDLTWGGRNIYAFDPNAAPGVRLQYDKDSFYVFAGAKTAVGDYKDPLTGEPQEQAYYGGLFGIGSELGDHVRLEAGAGTFQQGQMTTALDTSSPVYLQPIDAMGGCAQVAFRTTKEIDYITTQELRLYRNTPDFVRDSYLSHRELDGFGVLVQAEINVLAHDLIDFENVDSTRVERAVAGDIQTLFAFGTSEIAADLVYKDLPYIVFNVPGLTSGYTVPTTVETTPQIYGRFRGAHYFPKPRLTPSLGAGYMIAATYGTPEDGYIVVQDERNKYDVPDGQKPSALLSGVAGLQWDISKSTVAVGEVLYTLNNNLSDFAATEGDQGVNVLAPANERNQLGLNLMIRSRF
jgi:hypothetical protein